MDAVLIEMAQLKDNMIHNWPLLVLGAVSILILVILKRYFMEVYYNSKWSRKDTLLHLLFGFLIGLLLFLK